MPDDVRGWVLFLKQPVLPVKRLTRRDRGEMMTAVVGPSVEPLSMPQIAMEAEILQERKQRARKIVRALKKAYPAAKCALHYESPFQLLVATILSAQCTDERVNMVTRELFARYPDAESMAKVPLARLEKLIQSTGFFRNKAKNIKAMSEALVREYGGEVPQDLEKLVALPGVGRKTANVVLGTAFGIPSGVVVDTHVARISRRLGLTDEKDPVKIERDLMEILPRREWIDFSHRLIHHGRKICKARKPLCEECVLERYCPRIGVAG